MAEHEFFSQVPQADVDDLPNALLAKANESEVVKNSGTQTLNNAFVFNVAPQVAVGTLLSHPVRRDDPRLTDARTPTAHVHDASDVSTGVLAAARLPNVQTVLRAAIGASGTINTDASIQGTNLDITATGNITIAVPSNGTNRQVLQFAVLASGATRSVTLNASIRLTEGYTSRVFSVPSGQLLRFSLEYSTLLGAWFLTAAAITT